MEAFRLLAKARWGFSFQGWSCRGEQLTRSSLTPNRQSLSFHPRARRDDRVIWQLKVFQIQISPAANAGSIQIPAPRQWPRGEQGPFPAICPGRHNYRGKGATRQPWVIAGRWNLSSLRVQPTLAQAGKTCQNVRPAVVLPATISV